MEINRLTIEALLVFLYNIGEYDACEEMLFVYKKYFFELSVVKKKLNPSRRKLKYLPYLIST